MTKEQFISGTPFYINGKLYKGESTYNYNDGCICKQIRSSSDERIIDDSYHCNVTEVGKSSFVGFTFILGKRTRVKLKFAQLQEFTQEEA